MPCLVLLRHGQSQWNLDNRFTGWWDVDLSEQGIEEAWAAGRLLVKHKFDFDHCYTSLLTRAIRTQNIVRTEMNRLWLPVHKRWRLNERHYGALTGLNKAETAAEFGEEQVQIWRRSYDVAPPPIEPGSQYDVSRDRRYAGMFVPPSESLKDTIARVLPYWHDDIAPKLLDNQRVLIVAHGNSLRALEKHLSGISDDDITRLEIPTGQPIVYELNEKLKPKRRYTLD